LTTVVVGRIVSVGVVVASVLSAVSDIPDRGHEGATHGVAVVVCISRGLGASVVAVTLLAVRYTLNDKRLLSSHLAVCSATSDGVGGVAIGRARVASRVASRAAFAGHFD
jgi:hypothetical protein